MSTTLTPSSAQLWPTATCYDVRKRGAGQIYETNGCGNACLATSVEDHSSSPPASHASQPVPPVSDKAVQMTVGSGLKLCEWLPDSGPVGACLKTLLASPAWRSPLRSLEWTLKGYAGSPDEPSLKSSGDLTFWDMTSPETGMVSLGFRVCRLSVSELSTEGTGSGSSPDGEMWLTPSANEDAAGTPNGQMQVMLTHQAKGHAELWSSPNARDHKGEPGKQCTLNGGDGASLPRDVNCQTGQPPSSNAEPTASRGQLNPDFVCWLMGYPAGWLNYADSATPSSPKSRCKSSDQSSKVTL